MDALQLRAELARKTDQLNTYMRDQFPQQAAAQAIRFVEGNFRAQGWQGRPFLPWKKNNRGGTILVQRGRLRRATRTTITPYQMRIYNATPYARFHNRGFKGTVNIPAHTRNTYTAVRVATGRLTASGNPRMRTEHHITGTTQVRAHTRQMNIPRRQFMPESGSESPVLNSALKRTLINGIKAIFN